MNLASTIILLVLVILLAWIFAVRCRRGNAALPLLQQYRYAIAGCTTPRSRKTPWLPFALL